jgi:hypothetical protein
MNWLSNPEQVLCLVLPVNVLCQVGCLIHIRKVNTLYPEGAYLNQLSWLFQSYDRV